MKTRQTPTATDPRWNAVLARDPAADAPAPLAAPAQWTAATGSAQPTALAQWWQRFNDPTLTSLVTQALQANTSVKSAQAALRQARAQRDAQAAANGPSVGVSASAQPLHRLFNLGLPLIRVSPIISRACTCGCAAMACRTSVSGGR